MRFTWTSSNRSDASRRGTTGNPKQRAPRPRQWNRATLCLLAALAWPPLAARSADVETVAKSLQFPEGTVFVGDTLYFVDYATSDVLRLASGKVQTVWHQDGCGANGLLPVPDGLLVACFDGGSVARISLAGKLLATIEHDDAGHPLVAPNDLAADAKGGVYFTASGAGGPSGKVYYIGADRHVTEVAGGIAFANGVAVSPDGKTLFVGETPANRILQFTIGQTGSLTDRRTFVNLGDLVAGGSPDGVRIDKHGNLFAALFRGQGFAVIGPNGRLVAQVHLPGAHHTNLAIAPDGQSVYATAVDDDPTGGYRGALVRVANPVEE
jgi:gluconolactonase